MGCCQATLITELPTRAAQANNTTGIFLPKIESEYNDDDSDAEDVLDDDHNTGVAPLQGGFVRYDDCAMTATRTEHAVAASSQDCITPPDSRKSCSRKEKSRFDAFEAFQSCY